MKFYCCISPAAYHFRGTQQEVRFFLSVGGHVRVFSRSNRAIQLEEKAAQDEIWKNNFQRENNEELTKAPREFILLFPFSPLVTAAEEAGTEMTLPSQVISLIHLWGKLDKIKENFPRTQPLTLVSPSTSAKQVLHAEGCPAW